MERLYQGGLDIVPADVCLYDLSAGVLFLMILSKTCRVQYFLLGTGRTAIAVGASILGHCGVTNSPNFDELLQL